mmetsp:Transcript_29379/g.40762  ORF Transcript_29379/g.40762 Transcript_29379/m.40762 type:complete len:169 (+) Transcript_29379:151-657(+)
MQRRKLLNKITTIKHILEAILASIHHPAYPTITAPARYSSASSFSSSSSSYTLSKTIPPTSPLPKDTSFKAPKKEEVPSSHDSFSYDECVRHVAALLEEDKFGKILQQQLVHNDGSSGSSQNCCYKGNGHRNRLRKRIPFVYSGRGGGGGGRYAGKKRESGRRLHHSK